MKQLMIVILLLGFANMAEADFFKKAGKVVTNEVSKLNNAANDIRSAERTVNRGYQNNKDCGIGFSENREGEATAGIKCKGNTEMDSFVPNGDNLVGKKRNSEDSPW